MALRRTAASMRRPCSRSVKSCRAALTIAEATAAAARIESGAALAPPTRDSVMRGVFRRAGKGPNRPALSSPPRLKPFAARLFLLGLPNRKGADAARRPQSSYKRQTTGAIRRSNAIRRQQVVAADLHRARSPAPHFRTGIRATVPLHPATRLGLR